MMRLSESKRERALILPSESIFAVFRRQRYGDYLKHAIPKTDEIACIKTIQGKEAIVYAL